MSRKLSLLAAGVIAFGAVSSAIANETFPERPIRIVVPFGPGGGGDFIARAWSNELAEVLKQPVIIENKGGGNTVLGTQTVAQAKPDGYTLLFVSQAIATNPTLLPELPYQTPGSFAPVARVITYAMGFAVNAKLPYNNVQDLIAFARKNPGDLSMATSGEGSATDLATEEFMAATDTKVMKVPFKGAKDGAVAVASGHVASLFTGMSQLKPLIDSGMIRLIGTSGSQRLVSAPDVPTIAEQGVKGFDAVVWWGVLAPAGTPKPIVDKINAALKQALQQPQVQERLKVIDGVVQVTSPSEFESYIVAEIAKFKALLKPASTAK